MNKKTKILTIATMLSIATSIVIADSGWYPTRKSTFQTNRELETKTTNQRDLITDCLERNINLSCHRAGVW
jgi:cell division protein FtsL